MKKILVATFSERSDRAIRRGTLLAKMFDAAITLVHVIDDDQPKRTVKAEQRAATDLLEEQTRSMRKLDGLRCESKIVLGQPSEGIVQAAQEDDVDLLIIGPHRRQALKDVFVGTTAERTIRASSRPVLMTNGVPAGPYRNILVAVDLSECSADAIRAAQSLGLTEAAATSVIHVFYAPASGLMARTSSTPDQIRDYMAGEEEGAVAELGKFLADVDFSPVQLITKHGESSAARDIYATAREQSSDLIVVGTHGRTGIAKTLLGSVAKEILRISEKDVLAVPPQGAAGAE